MLYIVICMALFACWKFIALHRETGQARFRRWGIAAAWGCVGAFIGSSAGLAMWGSAIAATIPGFFAGFLIANNMMKVDQESPPAPAVIVQPLPPALPAATPHPQPAAAPASQPYWYLWYLIIVLVLALIFVVSVNDHTAPATSTTPPPAPAQAPEQQTRQMPFAPLAPQSVHPHPKSEQRQVLPCIYNTVMADAEVG